MKEMLMEVYKTTKKATGIDPSKPGNMKEILTNEQAFQTYVTGLAESLEDKKEREQFIQLAENTRVNLLENSMFQINPYETLTLPILRVFFPKIVAKEAVTVSPMDKPETIKAFIRTKFLQSNASDVDANWKSSPSVSNDISQGAGIGTPVAAEIDITAVTSAGFDVLDAIGSLTSDMAHLERDFTITGVYDGTAWVAVDILPAVEGHFSEPVTLTGGDDVISGKVDYLKGLLFISATASVVTDIRYSVTTTLEENQINPKVELTVDKVRLYARDRQISANWSINLEQDMRALFDVSMQAEIVNVIGQQIALDIDREIISALKTGNTNLNAASHTGSFTRTAPSGYSWGDKYWHENIVVELNKLSAQIYTDTNIDQGNTILANPVDAAILEDLQTFNYTGTSSVNGDLGFRSATVAGGKWKVLTSSVVDQGSMIITYKPVEELKCVYLYCPYVPAVLHPYPLGNTPSLTLLSRYATSMVRVAGIAQLDIS